MKSNNEKNRRASENEKGAIAARLRRLALAAAAARSRGWRMRCCGGSGRRRGRGCGGGRRPRARNRSALAACKPTWAVAAGSRAFLRLCAPAAPSLRQRAARGACRAGQGARGAEEERCIGCGGGREKKSGEKKGRADRHQRGPAGRWCQCVVGRGRRCSTQWQAARALVSLSSLLGERQGEKERERV